MTKFIILALAAIAVAVCTVENAAAQRKITTTGVIADADTGDGIIGAVVAIEPEADPTAAVHIVSRSGGVFSTGLERGNYNVSVSYLGYDTLRRRVTVDGRTALDTLRIRRGIVLDAVRKEAVAMRTSLEGDTLIYNADSYKVAADADIGTLLQKMPGIKVENGAVEAQGETVKKVLIDGREYFGEDVGAAISSLPAEAVKSVEVFDKLSDNAEFTGIDDGEGYKAINIRTRESMRQGVMGQATALYGVEPPDKNDSRWHHYGLASANVNIFNGDAKITLGGTVNNVNERSFTPDDFLGAGGPGGESDNNSGIAKVGRIQANYIDAWGKKNQWNIDAMYRYNVTDATDNARIEREYFADDNFRSMYSDSRVGAVNQNHIFRARIDFKPNQYHELRIRPMVRYQGNSSTSTGYETYYPLDAASGEIGPLDNDADNDKAGLRSGLNANYRVRLGKPGRTLSMFAMGGYSFSDMAGRSLYNKLMPDNVTLTRDGERSTTYNWGYEVWGGITYTEPVSKNSLVSLDYSVRYSYSDQDRRASLWDEAAADYMTSQDDNYSGVYTSGYLTHRVGPGYRLQNGETTFSAGIYYERANLSSDRVLPVASKLNRGFNAATYSAMVNSKFGGGASLRLFLFSHTENPQIADLQDVFDRSESQNIKRGNVNLRPAYENRMFLRFILPNVEKGRTFSLHMHAGYTLNSITRRTISNSPGYEVKNSNGVTEATLNSVGRYSEPINMDGEWNAMLGLDYGFPLEFMKSNLNINGMATYEELPSQMGRWTAADGLVWTENRSRNFGAHIGLTLGSNISEKIDFRIGGNVSYTGVRNTFSSDAGSDYLTHRVSANMKFVLPLDFTISGDVTYEGQDLLRGTSQGSRNRRFVLMNASVGKKLLRDRSLEVSLFVNDILNQNISSYRRSYAQYVQNEINSVVGRYFGVKLTWNIRFFGKNGSQNPAMYSTPTEHREHRQGVGVWVPH